MLHSINKKCLNTQNKNSCFIYIANKKNRLIQAVLLILIQLILQNTWERALLSS